MQGSQGVTGEECRACVARRAERRADRLAGRIVPAGRQARRKTTVECVDCDRPITGTAPEDGVCERCHEEAVAAVAAVAAKLAQEAGATVNEQIHAEEWTAHDDQEHEDEEEQRATEERAAKERAEAEETARLRAQLVREFPELAAVSSSVQAASAPF